ncbi:MAG TPA: nuclear transport factor 2 family protein [Dongiaceae bacterium]|nr:nuclear transport factor 2 family protein [Dongiaceae bacterium]
MRDKAESPLEVVMAINAMEAQLRQAMLTSDVDALEMLLAEDLIFVDPQGRVLDKAADLAAHRSGLLQLDQLDFAETEVRPQGDVAVVVTRSSLSGRYQGQVFAGDFRYTRVWRRSGRGWRVVAGHCSSVA